MRIAAGFNLAFDSIDYTPMMLMINVHPDRVGDLIEPENFTLLPPTSYVTYQDAFGNICTRLIAPPGRLSIWNRFVISDCGVEEQLPTGAHQHPVPELPNEALMFLLGSRYCDTQKLQEFAWSNFGGYRKGWPLVEAILNYSNSRLKFSYPNARSDRTAHDAHQEQIGVCRDFAHLAITLCRCMNVPARYCTGYLGDIGVPRDPAPMDFSAWFEVYLSGKWWPLDARHNKPRIGRILMARGRDAVDTAISTAFGQAVLSEFTVFTDELNS